MRWMVAPQGAVVTGVRTHASVVLADGTELMPGLGRIVPGGVHCPPRAATAACSWRAHSCLRVPPASHPPLVLRRRLQLIDRDASRERACAVPGQGLPWVHGSFALGLFSVSRGGPGPVRCRSLLVLGVFRVASSLRRQPSDAGCMSCRSLAGRGRRSSQVSFLPAPLRLKAVGRLSASPVPLRLGTYGKGCK